MLDSLGTGLNVASCCNSFVWGFKMFPNFCKIRKPLLPPPPSALLELDNLNFIRKIDAKNELKNPAFIEKMGS